MRSLGVERFAVPLSSISSSWDGNEGSLRVSLPDENRESREDMLKFKRDSVAALAENFWFQNGLISKWTDFEMD